MVATERPHAESSVGLVLVAGPPGSGKGTQCERLAQRHGWGHLSSGDQFRDQIARRTPLGLELEALIASGGLVPDDLTVEVVLRALDDMSDARVLLDGFPRTLPQARTLLDRTSRHVVQTVIELVVPPRVSFERLAVRSRTDDDVASLRLRLALYESQTRPMLEWLTGMGMVVAVDGDQPPDAVGAEIAARLANLAAPDVTGTVLGSGASTSSSTGAATA